MIATRLPLPELPPAREQRLRAALHERGWADVGLLLVVTDLDVSTLDGTRPRRPNLRRPEHTIRSPQVGRFHSGRILGTAREPTDRREHLAISLKPADCREPGECPEAHSLKPAAGRGLSGTT